MLNTEQCKKIDPNLKNLPDEEIIKIRESLYDLGQLIFDDWLENIGSSKYPARVFEKLAESNKLGPWTNKNQKQV